MEKEQNFFIKRCFDLARMGAGSVSPNPMVGAVLVHNGKIIGEGFHQRYGGAHAEVNAVASVAEHERALISQSTLYVSLEPCCIYGKTPPCTNLIIQEKIPKVVISCLDLTPEVRGRGVELLRSQGVEVISGVLEEEGKELAATRNVAVSKQRPYIILKMAVSSNGFFAPLNRSQFWLTQATTQRLVHRWRSETDAILIGSTTALMDDPRLDNRHYFGKSPLRIVLDRNLSLPKRLNVFTDGQRTLLVSERIPDTGNSAQVQSLQLAFDESFWEKLMHILWMKYKLGVVLIEGGAKIFESIIAAQMWDEARVLEGKNAMENGIPAPEIPGILTKKKTLGLDGLKVYKNIHRS
ncbi:MAG: bifunctional diaminohydroxyphosphoribosylaminopyrimidine deaminase/5-amino-6-(5-phosphoribosylamino)uracil reductase RibD [Haliscomenobacter sp.]|uniref:bifunctional diaminohydroxyphosphoribosylaminopyrimidine deaminase/5-amino-6-(5-phosphoribosylamino)uracil reductase RibD n=1 Tax=Haliscomenobacter sp. TaxID=2717303 RepID=UPI0029BB542C|nr:bifunctional diaminohydroxyphosphoribosylaminopyrimidine deaminase/5-amino-6-(5-phosphoribosylamino)uracil reductase RibD [Haliscomenobacter sp.]MDX2067521.1 bifunctional diaminohydroxyphosphoribosylaminopyrimidine deaminase/5-amino-6-(5-phosphoribosylamino)uracil reductase RibD [Haliscomenobacter sp.]